MKTTHERGGIDPRCSRQQKRKRWCGQSVGGWYSSKACANERMDEDGTWMACRWEGVNT